MRRLAFVSVLALAAIVLVGVAGAAPGSDVRLTNDNGGGYVSAYTLAGLGAYTDDVLTTCSSSRGRQNEPSVAIDPRDTHVLIGSSNDYCGVFPLSSPTTASGPVWLGYYRSENSGGSFTSSLVPGYPGDTSQFAQLAQIRTASSGDPVITWDGEGRVFLGSESSDDPAGTAKTFGDVWVARYVNPAEVTGGTPNTLNDGKRYAGTTLVARGSSAPNLLGKFNDKTAIMADHNGGKCANNVYFSWSRFSGNAQTNAVYFVRSTDHGATFSQPQKLSAGVHGVQFPDIAVTGNSDVYVTWRQFESQSGQPNAVVYVRSTDCGQTFSRPQTVQTFIGYDAQDVRAPLPVPTPTVPEDQFGEEGSDVQGNARDCGDFADRCKSGYTFFRWDTQVRSAADQSASSSDDTVYVVYDASKPGTEVDTGTTFGSIEVGRGSQAGVYFLSFHGSTGAEAAGPMLLHDESWGHQLFPDISADHGSLHALWWDSHNDPSFSPARPVGNDSSGHLYRSLDVYASSSTTATPSAWSTATRVTDYTSNPNFEQFDARAVPFAGDYLWIDSVGAFSFGTWTDWRDTVAGTDQREDPALGGTPDEDEASSPEFPGAFVSTGDVKQCRSVVTIPATKKSPETKTFGPDACPFAGGLDQNIYGDSTP